MLYLHCNGWVSHTEFNGDAITLGGLGACPVKIMILEVKFLLTSFDSTSATYQNLVFGTE